MFTFFTSQTTLRAGLISWLIVAMTLVPIFTLTVSPQAAHAGGGGGAVHVVSDTSATSLKNLVENTATAISGGLTAGATTQLAFKETVLDPIAYMAAKVLLRSIVRSIINWINSGFQGSPAFVTDLGGFLRDVADETIGEFIYNDPALNFLCSPFQLDVKIALATNYSESREGNYEPQCTLSEVTDNVEGFLEGSFSDGGWESWFELTQNPENTPVGAYFSAQSEAYARIINEQGEEITRLDFGDGFFSIEICDVAEQASGARPNCTIGTPGSVIADQINRSLGAGQDELIAADEINEIFNALFAQLAKQAITGINGLLGLGGNSGYSDYSFGETGSSTFLDAIAEEDASSTDALELTHEPLEQALAAEQRYLELQYQVIGQIEAAINNYNEVKEELEEQNCTIFDFPDELIEIKEEAEAEVALSLDIITVLEVLKSQFEDASTLAEYTDIIVQFEELDEQDLFRTMQDTLPLELFVEFDLVLALDELEADIAAAERNCSNANGS